MRVDLIDPGHELLEGGTCRDGRVGEVVQTLVVFARLGVPCVRMVIERPVSDKSLDTTRIALMRSPTQVEYYANSGWIDRAPTMIQTLMIESFENSGKIVSVGRENIGLRSDYVLKVELREFSAFGNSRVRPCGTSPRLEPLPHRRWGCAPIDWR